MVGYYGKLIPNFAQLAVPLTDLTKKEDLTKLNADRRKKMAFHVLKDILTETPFFQEFESET